MGVTPQKTTKEKENTVFRETPCSYVDETPCYKHAPTFLCDIRQVCSSVLKNRTFSNVSGVCLDSQG